MHDEIGIACVAIDVFGPGQSVSRLGAIITPLGCEWV